MSVVDCDIEAEEEEEGLFKEEEEKEKVSKETLLEEEEEERGSGGKELQMLQVQLFIGICIYSEKIPKGF